MKQLTVTLIIVTFHEECDNRQITTQASCISSNRPAHYASLFFLWRVTITLLTSLICQCLCIEQCTQMLVQCFAGQLSTGRSKEAVAIKRIITRDMQGIIWGEPDLAVTVQS